MSSSSSSMQPYKRVPFEDAAPGALRLSYDPSTDKRSVDWNQRPVPKIQKADRRPFKNNWFNNRNGNNRHTNTNGNRRFNKNRNNNSNRNNSNRTNNNNRNRKNLQANSNNNNNNNRQQTAPQNGAITIPRQAASASSTAPTRRVRTEVALYVQCERNEHCHYKTLVCYPGQHIEVLHRNNGGSITIDQVIVCPGASFEPNQSHVDAGSFTMGHILYEDAEDDNDEDDEEQVYVGDDEASEDYH